MASPEGCQIALVEEARQPQQVEKALKYLKCRQEEKTMIYKRGNIYWYKFMWNGEPVRESTKQGNDKVARQIESAHRTSLAKGEVGIREKKASPTLAEFIDKRFEPWVKSTFEKTSPKTWFDYYRVGLRNIRAYDLLANSKLDEINVESVTCFAAHRQAQGLQISSVNSSLQILRRVLRVAVEWGALNAAPSIRMLPGARSRERVVDRVEEAKYLAAAGESLSSVAGVLIDTGLRPEECFRLRWESITWLNGRHGTLLVTHGKTAAARRVLPMTPRVKTILLKRWEPAGRPAEGWVWSAPTRSGHLEGSSLKKQHLKALRISGVRPFVLYSLRHTFLTRLGESGCDAWTLARIAGHSSIAMSTRYVHPSEDAVLNAMSRLGGHNSRHSDKETDSKDSGNPLLAN
jgi:integrase